MDMSGSSVKDKGLRSHRWLLSYKTSATVIDGRPVDILQDFYIPALRLAVRYDRVAGYFRSSSLAAASQGFSSFVGRRGRMRLVVGADLEPADVRAILDGDRERLAVLLNGELDRPESWPANVQNGVTLLAWMVSKGYLEVRVAFRVHGETGEPLSYDAVDDGYVHEKWFILYDEFGNRLYGAGTLNESKTALVLNAENIDVHCDWWGDIERLRADKAAEDFENLWAGRVPHMPVMSLPEAVRRRLVRFAEGVERLKEIDGTVSKPGVGQSPSALERLQFAVLRDAPKMPGGRFVGIETAPVEPWPHQAVVVRRLVETWPYSYLLCDEVGLGKTIEAGLAFRSLYLSGLVKRILIAAPASLTKQWHRQMASKMLLSFGRARTMPETCHEYIFPVAETRPAASIYDSDLVIVSTGLLSRRERLPALMQAKRFDIALVDEAHAARRRNPSGGPGANPDFGHLYLAIRDYLRRQAGSLWLATATPMQINPVEVSDLLALTNRVGAFQFDPNLTQQYYDILGKIISKQKINDHEWSFLRRVLQTVAVQDPMLWRFIEENVIDGRIRVTVKQWLENGRIPPGRDRTLMSRLVFSVSPLSRVMLRHTRRLLEIYRENGMLQQNLAKRHILPIPRIEFTQLERRIYDQLENYCQDLAKQIRIHGDSQSRQMMSFLLSFLRLRFASSLYAFRETLQNRLDKVEATLRHQSVVGVDESEPGASSLEDLVYDGEDEDDLPAAQSLLKNRTPEDLKWERERLRDMLRDMADLTGPSSKMQELLQTLDRRKHRQTGRIRQTVIFTRFYDTLTDIVSRLRQADQRMLIGTYSGRGAEYYDPVKDQMVNVEREEVKEMFLRSEIDVLVCTDAAAEGLNLQTADLLINFDLGWNPMKVEQRIGRIDRIGQKHKDIFVLNLCYIGSAEQIVYGRLLTRLAEANMIVGTQQISLLPVTPEDFQELAEGKLTSEGLEARAGERIELQRRQTEGMEISPGDLYEIYMRMARKKSFAPVNLASIWEALSKSRYLIDLGYVVPAESKQMLILNGFENITDGLVLTVSRDLYEKGLANGGLRVHFASYGDPLFDAVLEHFGSFGLPACIRRISVSVHGLDDMEMVGYAVACRSPGGSEEVRLIRSWPDLDGLQLNEAVSLTEAEVAPLREQLKRMAWEEAQTYLAAERIERDNLRAAYAHELLNYLVARGLLELRAEFAGERALYLPVLREAESLYQDRDRVNLPDLPADIIKQVKGDLLFECHVPGVGNKAQLYVPHVLAHTALSATNRLVDSMKVKKSELRVDTVFARLEREIEVKRRQIS
jgi:hypothetical protein